jgi:hypothetical protein
MADEPQSPFQWPPLPEQVGLNHQLLAEWVKILPEQPVAGLLTRSDIDHLYFSFMKLVQAQDAMHNVVSEWSNGRLENANKALWESKRLTIESQNHLRQAFNAVMAAVIQGRK